MLITVNKFDKSNSKYMCDRCKKYMGNFQRYGIYISNGIRTPHKKWDLCEKCYRALERGIGKNN